MMKRNLVRLSGGLYDVLVIGGGIYGVCVAWDAALRGLSVALVEKGDFGHATSANSLRVIHGGLRYLQYGDIPRMRRSIRERTAFMRIAPHLVHPLPIVIPTYGHSLRGKEIFSLALSVDNLVGFDRNRVADSHKHIPQGRLLSTEECTRLFPYVERKGLTGGVIVYDCQMSNSERLVLSFARAAAAAGADLANYTEAIELTKERDRITGVKARDTLTGDVFPIRAEVTVNASGPWLDDVLGLVRGHGGQRRLAFSRAFNLRTKRELISQYAVGVYSQPTVSKDSNSIRRIGSRLYFIIPWGGRSLIGTGHLSHDGDPNNVQVTEAEIEAFLDDLKRGCPGICLSRHDVDHVYAGLLPMTGYDRAGVRLLRQPRLYDHREEEWAGLLSVAGVKFTEARYVAEKVVDKIFVQSGKASSRASLTALTPVYGGAIEHFDRFLAEATRRRPAALSAEIVHHLVHTYGSAYREVLEYLHPNFQSNETSPCVAAPSSFSSAALVDQKGGEDFLPVLRALVLHAVRDEMAQKLSDVVFRRTWLGNATNLDDAYLRKCAVIMSRELEWDTMRTHKELEEVKSSFRSHLVGDGMGQGAVQQDCVKVAP